MYQSRNRVILYYPLLMLFFNYLLLLKLFILFWLWNGFRRRYWLFGLAMFMAWLICWSLFRTGIGNGFFTLYWLAKFLFIHYLLFALLFPLDRRFINIFFFHLSLLFNLFLSLLFTTLLFILFLLTLHVLHKFIILQHFQTEFKQFWKLFDFEFLLLIFFCELVSFIVLLFCLLQHFSILLILNLSQICFMIFIVVNGTTQ